MDAFLVTTELTTDDWRALQGACAKRMQSAIRGWVEYATWMGCVAVAFLVFVAMDMVGVEISLLSFAVGAAFVAAAVWIAKRKRLVPGDSAFLGECRYEFDNEGFGASKPGVNTRCAWSALRDVTNTAEHLFLWIDRFAAFVVPLRDLPNGLSMAEAMARIRHWAGSTQIALATIPEEKQTARLTPWWLALPRLWVLRKVADGSLVTSERAVVVLSLASLFIWSLLDRLSAGENAQFNSYNLPVLALCAVVMLLLARILAKRRSAGIGFQNALFAVVGVLPVAIVAMAAIDAFIPAWDVLALLALLIYIGVYFARAFRAITGTSQPATVILAITAIVILGAASESLYWTPSLWYAPDTEEEAAQPTWSNGEALLFEQHERLDRALEKVNANTTAEPAMYFVGFAGVAEQKVFAEEIALAARVVGDRYDATQRTLLLLNDRRDVDTQPLATVSGLRYALKGMAKKMDVQRDVLFLSLSSHGSDEPVLSVSNGILPLQQITAENLASALAESGIKWRVIVISACHAGSFIESLKDPNTIIIAAAAADKTSFGCSDDRDLTYFGEAFYRDALPQAQSLRDAFKTAKMAIGAREKKEKVTASDPQAYFGEALDKKLLR